MTAALIEAAKAALGALQMTAVLKSCGGMLPGVREPIMLAVNDAEAAIPALRTALAAAEQPAEPVALTPAAMKRGGFYNWKNQPDRLIYLRRFDGWHQFKKIGDPREVWCEVLDGDLHMLEETAASPAAPAQPLTDEQIEGIRIDLCDRYIIGKLLAQVFARAIERAHGIGGKQ